MLFKSCYIGTASNSCGEPVPGARRQLLLEGGKAWHSLVREHMHRVSSEQGRKKSEITYLFSNSNWRQCFIKELSGHISFSHYLDVFSESFSAAGSALRCTHPMAI